MQNMTVDGMICKRGTAVRNRFWKVSAPGVIEDGARTDFAH